MAYREVRGRAEESWKPQNEGDFIEGTLLEKKSDVGPNRSMLYLIETPEGRKVNIWGSTVLDDRFASIEVGQQVRVEYLGRKTNPRTGRLFKDFRVLVDDGEQQ